MGDNERRLEDAAREQAAFNALRDALLASGHRGKHVLFHAGKVEGFFNSPADAYAKGLDQYGIDAVFLVAHVVDAKVEEGPISLSWELGLMDGRS